jgi:hypothetical protein
MAKRKQPKKKRIVIIESLKLGNLSYRPHCYYWVNSDVAEDLVAEEKAFHDADVQELDDGSLVYPSPEVEEVEEQEQVIEVEELDDAAQDIALEVPADEQAQGE